MTGAMNQDAYGCGGDRHMNLFCVYNESYQFIENNLTRAWIHSLRLLSGKTRNRLLRALLQRIPQSSTETLPNFSNAKFALQNQIDRTIPRKRVRRRILAIATHRFEGLEGNVDRITGKELLFEPETSGSGTSIPDAWIYDDGAEDYVYLVESKIGENPLNAPQLEQEARDWLGASARGHVLPLTWLDVLEAIEEINKTSDVKLNKQERLVLAALTEYLGFYQYRLFKGFKFGAIKDPPSSAILAHSPNAFFRFAALAAPPAFHLKVGKVSNK